MRAVDESVGIRTGARSGGPSLGRTVLGAKIAAASQNLNKSARIEDGSNEQGFEPCSIFLVPAQRIA